MPYDEQSLAAVLQQCADAAGETASGGTRGLTQLAAALEAADAALEAALEAALDTPLATPLDGVVEQATSPHALADLRDALGDHFAALSAAGVGGSERRAIAKALAARLDERDPKGSRAARGETC